ncbi:MAG: hypothetical protein ABS79_06940, partial [Planctomycetes bacterium SCN 63-9]
MIGLILWGMALFYNAPEEREMTERMTPVTWQGNFWGPEAARARKEGKLPPISMTPQMQRWDRWGRQVLKSGDIVFRLGDARLMHGYFPMSRFYANTSNSKFSHTAIVSIEDEEEGPVVYDTTRTSVARQPFAVWVLDNVGSIGVKRLRPQYRKEIPRITAFCRQIFESQPPFDYELSLDDKAYYCVEMTEKAFRSAGLPLSEPVRLGDMERATEKPIPMFVIMYSSKFFLDRPLSFEHPVYFPGNDRHGIWSSPKLETVVPPTFAPGYPGLDRGAGGVVR